MEVVVWAAVVLGGLLLVVGVVVVVVVLGLLLRPGWREWVDEVWRSPRG